MKAYIVIEPGEAIWACFKKKKTAQRFLWREFSDLGRLVMVKKIHVRRSLKKTPTTIDDGLHFEIDLSRGVQRVPRDAVSK